MQEQDFITKDLRPWNILISRWWSLHTEDNLHCVETCYFVWSLFTTLKKIAIIEGVSGLHSYSLEMGANNREDSFKQFLQQFWTVFDLFYPSLIIWCQQRACKLSRFWTKTNVLWIRHGLYLFYTNFQCVCPHSEGQMAVL